MTITPSVGIGERYDSNIYFAGEGQNVESDFLTVISPQISIGSERKGLKLGGLYRLDSIYYSSNDKLNTMNSRASIDMNIQLSQRSSLSMGDSFVYTQYSLDASDTGIQTRRTDITSDSIFLTVNHEFSAQTAAGITLRGSLMEFDDPSFIDTQTYSLIFTGDYKLSPDTTVKAAYDYTNFLFDTGKDTETHALQLGFTERFSSGLSVDISAGAVYMPEMNDQYDWTAGVNLGKSFQQATVRLGYTRDVTHTSGLTDEVNIRDRVSLSWNHQLTNSLNMTISGNLSKNNSKPSARVDTTSYGADISGTWRAYSWMSVDIGYSRFQQWDDNSATGDASRDQVFVTVTLYPVEWRL